MLGEPLYSGRRDLIHLFVRCTSCQDFEFPVLLVLLYVHVASLLYKSELDPTNSDSPPAMFWPATVYAVPVWNAVF